MQKQTHDPSIATYPRIEVVHVPRWPLKPRGLPLYALGEVGDRLADLSSVVASGVVRGWLVPVRAIPAWHLPSLRRKFTTYHRGSRTSYLVDGPAREVSLADVLRNELALQARIERDQRDRAPPRDPRLGKDLDAGDWGDEEEELLHEILREEALCG